MSNIQDFKRPPQISDGVLINTNNKALEAYKKTKKRMSSVSSLEKTVDFLVAEIKELRELIDDRNSNSN